LVQNYGWKAYGSGLFTSQKLISSNPDLVRRSSKGYKEAFEFCSGSPRGRPAEITAKAAPGYADKTDVLLAQIKAISHRRSLVLPPKNTVSAG